jgi:hypothetical protein
MSRKSSPKGQVVNTLFTMLLFLVFVLCALFTVLIGGRVYENINNRTESTYRSDVALSYIANKVRQQDEAGMVDIAEKEGISVLQLKQEINDSTYMTEIYYEDGKLWELFSDEASNISLSDGFEIMECSAVAMRKEGRMLCISTEENGSSIWLSLRSGGQADE